MMDRDAYFKFEIPRLKLKKCPCVQSHMVDLHNDTEKSKLKTKLLRDPKNYNHIT